MAKVSTLQQLGKEYYADSDLVDTLPDDREFNTLVKFHTSKPTGLYTCTCVKLGGGEGTLALSHPRFPCVVKKIHKVKHRQTT